MSGMETHRSILCYAVGHTHARVIQITTVAAAGTSFANRTNSKWYGNAQVYTLLVHVCQSYQNNDWQLPMENQNQVECGIHNLAHPVQ